MVDFDLLLEALAAEERRRVCRHLLSGEDAVTLDALAAHIATELGDVDAGPTIDLGGAADFDARLHHQHLPKLADAGVVEYDRESAIVAPGPTLPAARPILDALDAADEAVYRNL